MAAAYAADPERFIRAIPRPPALPTALWINPPATEVADIQCSATRQQHVVDGRAGTPLVGA